MSGALAHAETRIRDIRQDAEQILIAPYRGACHDDPAFAGQVRVWSAK